MRAIFLTVWNTIIIGRWNFQQSWKFLTSFHQSRIGRLFERQLQERHNEQRWKIREDGFEALQVVHQHQVVLPEADDGRSQEGEDLQGVVGQDQVPEVE